METLCCAECVGATWAALHKQTRKFAFYNGSHNLRCFVPCTTVVYSHRGQAFPCIPTLILFFLVLGNLRMLRHHWRSLNFELLNFEPREGNQPQSTKKFLHANTCFSVKINCKFRSFGSFWICFSQGCCLRDEFVKFDFEIFVCEGKMFQFCGLQNFVFQCTEVADVSESTNVF